jgi:cytochrome c-type biogenesis protein
VLFPAVFAVGSSLPLLGVAALLAIGAGGARDYAGSVRRAHRWLRPAATAVLVLAGLNDTLTYWLL